MKKKNRTLNVELKLEKSHHKELQNNFHELQSLVEEKNRQLDEIESQSKPSSPTEIQILSDKFDKASKKVFEVLNQNTQLKNDLRVAHKCLQHELGENANFGLILSGNSNWRGRAQQISMLNNKIADLNKKLEGVNFDFFDSSDRSPQKRLETVRRLEVESLSKELGDTKAHLDDVKQKLAASKARNKILVDDASSYKLKTLDLLEKSSRDEEFIKCLNEQVGIVKYECAHKLDEMKQEIERVERMKENSDIDIQKLLCDLQNKDETLNDKTNEIANLTFKVEDLERNLRDVSGDFLFSCREMSKAEYVTMLENLQQEKNKVLNFMQILNERLDKESTKVSEQHDTISKQRLKIARLEGKLRDYETEKEEVKTKNRRSLRISEYGRSQSNSSQCLSESNDRLSTEIDKQKFK